MGMGSGGPSGIDPQVMRKLENALKSPSSPQQHQDLLELLKRNPTLMGAYMKHKNPNTQGHHAPHPGHPPHMGGSMPQMRQDMWQHRRPPPVPSAIYQQGQNSAYPQQTMGTRAPMMPPGGMSSQYGMSQPRYHTAGPDSAGGMPQSMSGHQQQAMRATGAHNQLLHQVRSPNSLQQHTRSPQPIQSPHQSTASPALLQSSDSVSAGMGTGMMQPGTPSAQHNFSAMNPSGNMQPLGGDYADQQATFGGPTVGAGAPQRGIVQDNDVLSPQEELNKFVDGL